MRRSHPPAPHTAGRDLAALLPTFRAAQFALGHTPATVNAYSRLLRQIETWLVPVPAVDATTWQLFEFVAPRCRVDRVLASYLSRLRAFYGWAVALGIVAFDPTDALRRFQAAGLWPTTIEARTAVATQAATDGR